MIRRAGEFDVAVMIPWPARVRFVRHDPRIEHSIHGYRAPALARKRRRILRITAAPHVVAAVLVPFPLDPAVAKAHSPARTIAKAAAVSPGSVLMVVVSPRELPVVAPQRVPRVRRPVERHLRNYWARRIRRLPDGCQTRPQDNGQCRRAHVAFPFNDLSVQR